MIRKENNIKFPPDLVLILLDLLWYLLELNISTLAHKNKTITFFWNFYSGLVTYRIRDTQSVVSTQGKVIEMNTYKVLISQFIGAILNVTMNSRLEGLKLLIKILLLRLHFPMYQHLPTITVKIFDPFPGPKKKKGIRWSNKFQNYLIICINQK